MGSTRDKKPESETRRGRQRSGERVFSKARVRPQVFPYLLVLPALLFELLVHIFPMLVGVGVSFLELTQFYVRNWSAAPFVGFRNYLDGLDPSGPIGGALAQSFLITFAYTVLVVGGSWVLGISAAMLVNSEFRARKWFRALFLIPYALPVYVAVIAWSFMLQQKNGVMNTLLVDNLHLLEERPFWLIGNNAFWSVVMTSLWRSWPFAFLMLLAGLQSIPRPALRSGEHRRSLPVAPVPHDHTPSAAPGQPSAAARTVPLDVQRVQHTLRPVRPGSARRGGSALAAHLRQLVCGLELRARGVDVGAVAPVLANGFRDLYPRVAGRR